MRIKSMLPIAAALLMGLMLTGCKQHAKENDENTITITTGCYTSDTALVSRIIQEQFPEIDLQVDIYAGANTTTYLSEQLDHDDASDIFVYTTKLSDEQSKAHLLDLSGYSFVGNYDKGILENLDVDGGIYQLSGPINIRALFVNQTLFDLNGWKVPNNFAELVEVCRQIREEAPEIVPIALGTKGAAIPFGLVGGYAQCGFLNTPSGLAWEKRYFAGEASIEEGLGEGLDMMMQLIDAGAFAAEPYEEMWNPGFAALGERQCAMGYIMAKIQDYIPYFDGTAAEDKELYGKYADDQFQLLPFFGAQEGEEGINVYMSVAFGLSKRLGEKGNEKKLENALKIIEYLSSPEGQEKLKTNAGQIPVVGQGNPPAYYERLWNLGEYGAKRFYLYSGYEDVIVECGEMLKDAIRAESAEGVKENFIKTADTLHQKHLQGEPEAIYGTIAEDLSSEETVQVMRDAVQAQGLSDLTLATHSEEIDGILNRPGDPTGFAGKWYAGPVNEILLNVALGSRSEQIQTTQLTGAEIRRLIEDGSVRAVREDGSSVIFDYGWSGIDVTFDKDGKIVGMVCGGDKMQDDAYYTVAFPEADYSEEFAKTHEITDTGISALDAAKQYLLANSPIKVPKLD